MNRENEIVKLMSEIEVKLWILSDMIGPNEPEVREYENKLLALKLELLDYMCPEDLRGA